MSWITRLIINLKTVGALKTLDLVLWLFYLIGAVLVTAISLIKGESNCVGYLLIAAAVAGHTILIAIRISIWCWRRWARGEIRRRMRKAKTRMRVRSTRLIQKGVQNDPSSAEPQEAAEPQKR